jgi:arsenate reductase
MSDKIFNVLFLCTGNSARSVFAECILNRVGEDKFRAFSAGSHPRGEINPHTYIELQRNDYEVSGLRSKDWSEFAQPDAPVMDFVFTVCHNAAGELCPVWPGQPVTAHWGVEDPAGEPGDDIAKKRAFAKAYRALYNRISIFANLPIASLDRLRLQQEVDRIGRIGLDETTGEPT